MTAKSLVQRHAKRLRPFSVKTTAILTHTAMAARTALVLGLSGAAAMTTPAMAQSTATTTSASAAQTQEQAKEHAKALPEVTVQGQDSAAPLPYAGGQINTGGRVGLLGEKDFMETPFSTISYTESFIEDQHAQDISEVITKTDPTVFTSGIPGDSEEGYSIRGFSSSVGDVTVNGLAGMAAFYRSAPEMYERVEVLKGPSALLNGMPPRGSAGGAVNLVSKRAGNDPLTRLTASYMSRSYFGGHLDVGRRFGEDKSIGVRINGVYRNGETAVRTQDKKVSLASLGLDWRGTRARLSADLYRSKDHADAMTRGLSLAPGVSLPALPNPDVSWNPPWAFYDNNDKGAIVRGEFDVTDQFTAYASAGINKNGIDTIMAPGQITSNAGDLRVNFSGVGDRNTRKSAEVGLRGKFHTGDIGHQLAINATYYDEDRDFYGFRNVLPQDWLTNIYNPEWGPAAYRPSDLPRLSSTNNKLSSFGFADTLSFAQNRVQLTLGLRHQRVETTSFNGATGAVTGTPYSESATTPAAALLVKLNDKVSVYANTIEGLSQGAIAPSTTENAGEVFAPYKTKQKELGVKFDLGDFAHTVSLYEIKRPSSYTDPYTNIFSFDGEQRNRGVEWGFFGKPIEHVRLLGGIAYSDPKMTRTAGGVNQGKQATGMPKWQGKLGAEWDTTAVPGLTLTANVSAASKQYFTADNSVWMAGRVVYDLGTRYATQVSGRPLTLRLSVANITNKAYWARANYGGVALGAPRTINVSATMDF
ncbi:TonB-dependent siderophore receptor [Lampropedia puyangensis]|uniref:TonB-dependent siderophore receptor n=1 Tax=Lampropedia puyangensis TaxID=1330072 RepID=A0A4S8FCT3_9BURK|nr:TonB-dependent siderophore receptor [Lampropedia puyangensis]THU05119.1 TonB-dependent siderophore receptor [Lampropedia puyangensis]